MQTVSVIIEWENAKLSELERAHRMLAQLSKQMTEVAKKRELKADLIVLYDSDEISEDIPKQAVTESVDAAQWPGTIRFEKAPHQRYYEQKNSGADISGSDILIFLDSDVVPDAGWLEGLLNALDDPKVQVVGGETYHATDTFYDKIFAAFWTFGVRRPSRGVYSYKNFYANNFAVRREVFLNNKFPDAIAYRGQCTQAAKAMRAHGLTIYRQSASTVSHPPPVGAKTFVVRALCQGYDTIYWKGQRRFGMLFNTNPIASFVRLVRQWVKVIVKVSQRATKVGLGPLGVLAAVGAGFAFYFFKFAGEVVSFFTPGLIRSRLSV